MATVPPRLIEELYTVSPNAFTRERNAKAAALAKAGHADQATALKKLRRPTAALWATNQLAHADPKRLAALVQALGRLRGAQLRDPRGAMEALQRQRAELKGLVELAGERLKREGYGLTPATAHRISDTVLGASLDRRLADDLVHGRL